MSKKTLALIIFLFLVTCTLLYFSLRTTPQSTQPLGPTPTPISVNAHTLLSMNAASATESSKTAQYTVAVKIDTGDNPVNSVQMELAYDPQALTNVTLAPGTFFTQPNVLVNNINTTDGRISYALTEQIDLPGKKGTGTLALVSFNIAPTFTGKTTTLTFLPKTAVAADKVMESVLKKTTDYTVTLQTATTPTASVSPVLTK